MKKTLIFALVLGLAVMFAIPAFAFKIESAKDNTFYFGAAIFTDFGAWNYSKELGNQKSDKTQLLFDLAQHSRLRGVLEVGNVGAYWEIRMGSNQQNAQGLSGSFSSTGGYYFAESAKLYGYYKFGNCTLLAGKTDGHFFSVVAGQNMGYGNGAPTGGSPHIALFGFGNNYDNRNTQVRFSQEISKAFGYDISLVQPQYYQDNGTGSLTGAPGTTNAVQSYATFPLVAGKLRMNFGMVSLMPAAYVQYVKWDNLAPAAGGATPSDNMTSWAATLPVVVKAGAFTGTFAATYGQNMGTRLNVLQGVLQAESVWQGYARTPNGAIKDTTGWNAFMDLAFTSGAVTPHFYMGYDKAVNDDVYGKGLSSGSDNFNQRYAMGASVNWKIAESFYIVPEFTYWNYGKNPVVNGNPDLGTEWIGGVQFQFIF